MIDRLYTGAAYEFRLAQDHVKGHGKLPAVLIVHGWRSNTFRPDGPQTRLADLLSSMGYHTLQLSLRGHEGSLDNIETVSRAKHAQDIQAALEYMSHREEVDSRQLGAVGSSYGAYLLACMAPQLTSVNLLVLRAPALYRDAGWQESVEQALRVPDRVEWRKTIRTVAESRALKGVSEYRGDLLIVSSENDEDLPKEVVESYMLAATAVRSKLLVELVGATHSLSPEPLEKFLDVTSRWFKVRYHGTPQALVA